MLIKIFKYVGDFGEDKDAAAELRETLIKKALESGDDVVLDFEGVLLITQSFAHALISDILRTRGEDSLDHIDFKNCATLVRGIISTVVQYSLDTVPQLGAEDMN